MLTRVRIVLVDDSQMMRSAMRGLLRSEPGFEVVGEASDGPSGVRMTADLAPDVVLMDVRMPGDFDGIEATKRIIGAHGGTAATGVPVVIALSASGEYAQAMSDAGASAFVAKDGTHLLMGTIRDAIARRRR